MLAFIVEYSSSLLACSSSYRLGTVSAAGALWLPYPVSSVLALSWALKC